MNISNTDVFLATSEYKVIDIFEFVLTYIWAPVLVAVIISIGKFVFNDKLLYVKEIKRQNDSDISFFIELYNNRINKKYRICSEEVLSYIGINHKRDIQHHLYVCKKWNKTVGFIKFMVSKSQKYIFVAYVAIDNKDSAARKNGVNIMLKKISKKFFKPHIADKIIIECEKSKSGHHSAFSKLVARYANSNDKNAYLYDFDYIQPNMPNDKYETLPEENMSLVLVPYFVPSHTTINKEQLLHIIRMIYYDIYCPSCNSITNCCELDYSNYLERLLVNYDNNLPTTISLISLDKIH